MSLADDPEGRVAVVQMNSDLRHAQLDLLAAECATDRLRLRFSLDDVAVHAEPVVLGRAARAANALHAYYSSVEARRLRALPGSDRLELLSEEEIVESISRVSCYLQKQRDHYYALGKRLAQAHVSAMQPFFSVPLLASIRAVEMGGRRIPNPPFYRDAELKGIGNLPEVTHMPSLTFVDLILFNDQITERALFHGLVHAVQFQFLGLDNYTDIYVRGFLKRGSHVNVPLETHAIALEAKFAGGSKSFSVEEEIQRWIADGRYSRR